MAVKGIGNETADSILLFAYKQKQFKVDAYTKRIFSYLGYFDEKEKYMDIKKLFEASKEISKVKLMRTAMGTIKRKIKGSIWLLLLYLLYMSRIEFFRIIDGDEGNFAVKWYEINDLLLEGKQEWI